MKDLKQKTLRGGLARLCTQATNFIVRIGSLMILARLLNPKDFGIVGMVMAVIGVFNVFRDFGLSAAAVQRTSVTREQSSNLFWINIVVGAALCLIILAISPLIAAFYHEPRLVGVTVVMATGFLSNAAGVQHSALLEREMRFTALAVIDVTALVVSTAAGVILALMGLGYWALVATASLYPLGYTIGLWLSAKWIPGKPQNDAGIRSMMRFGITVTLQNLILYVANNLDKVLLGRFWGGEALGIYGRAYQLINIPSDNLNYSAGGVAFAALSRVKDEPNRLRNYFLKGYSIILSLTVPITFTCGLFAPDMIQVFLGPKWKSAVVVFQLLAPSALAVAILTPLGWLIASLGIVERGLKMAIVFGALMVLAYLFGLPHGMNGVAFSVSAMKVLSVLPLAAWVTHGTVVHLRDILVSVVRPLLSGCIASLAAFGFHVYYLQSIRPLPRLTLDLFVYFLIYFGTLMYVFGQKRLFLDLVRSIIQRAPRAEPIEQSA